MCEVILLGKSSTTAPAVSDVEQVSAVADIDRARGVLSVDGTRHALTVDQVHRLRRDLDKCFSDLS